MRYMLLIYSREDEAVTPEALGEVAARHGVVMQEAMRNGIFRAADPLVPTTVATSVRVTEGKVVITDGPFAETREQLAGYYILDCADLDEALGWAAKIPTGCQGGAGCVEVRPIREMGQPSPVNG